MEAKPVKLVVYGPGGRQRVNTYRVRSTGMYMRVTPKIVGRGPEIDLTVVPVVARPEKNAVEIEELRTRLRVRDGSKVVISGTDRMEKSIGSALFSTRKSNRKRRTVWILSPEILK